MKTREMIFIFIALFLIHFTLSSQEKVHSIPFASKGNQIELTLESAIDESNIKINMVDLPAWLRVSPDEYIIKQIPAGDRAKVNFEFSVNETAPVGKKQSVKFVVTS